MIKLFDNGAYLLNGTELVEYYGIRYPGEAQHI